jgi:hypothetical protein
MNFLLLVVSRLRIFYVKMCMIFSKIREGLSLVNFPEKKSSSDDDSRKVFTSRFFLNGISAEIVLRIRSESLRL